MQFWYAILCVPGVVLCPISLLAFMSALDYDMQDIRLGERATFWSLFRNRACFRVTPSLLVKILLGGVIWPVWVVMLGFSACVVSWAWIKSKRSFWDMTLFWTCGSKKE